MPPRHHQQSRSAIVAVRPLVPVSLHRALFGQLAVSRWPIMAFAIEGLPPEGSALPSLGASIPAGNSARIAPKVDVKYLPLTVFSCLFRAGSQHQRCLIRRILGDVLT
jgi:hypothetical protein